MNRSARRRRDQFPGLGIATGERKRCRDRPLVTRLMGLETEYATLVTDRRELSATQLPQPRAIFSEICRAICRRQPTVPGFYDREQLFLASGGAVTFELHPTVPGGLIELASPEVRSPSELIACQRGLDQLVAEAAAENQLGVDLRVLKNSSDAYGHLYGCQENYETTVARGPWLILYRMLILLLWGLQALSWLLALPLLLVLIAATLVRSKLVPTRERVADNASAHFAALPGWFTSILIRILRIIHLPAVMLLRFVARHVAFRDQRRHLTALLVSRVALCGAGDLDLEGRYRISAKAMAIDRVADMGGFRGERPIFVFGHWLTQLCATSGLSLATPCQMLRRRQRLQIGLSDSNLCELAEFVKIGSVSLVLDMIEAGKTAGLPTLNRPIDSLHRIARDRHLVSRVSTSCGDLSAIEIQKRYRKAAEAFVASTAANRRGEAPLVIQRWGESLAAVTAFRQNADHLDLALGRIDWLSKRWMIDGLRPDADWAMRKKIDLRYHELSPAGYHRQLTEALGACDLVNAEQVERRRRSPPAGSPAARRSWMIREFSGAGQQLYSEWKYAMVGRGRYWRRVDFVDDDP